MCGDEVGAGECEVADCVVWGLGVGSVFCGGCGKVG